jgi:FtsH-binding integral membrane protein
MSAEKAEKPSLKQKARHETVQLLAISLYLAFFFCALATYTMLTNASGESALTYGFALINALIVAKVILIGEYARLGKRVESKPLLFSAIYKAVLFTLFVLAFHFVEEIVKALLHGRSAATAFRVTHPSELLARTIIIFSIFVPFFAFRELRRVIGEDKFRDLFFRMGAPAKPEAPVEASKSKHGYAVSS